MPLIRDPEYATELDGAKNLVQAASRPYWLWNVVGTVVLLGGFLWQALAREWPEHVVIAGAVSLATVCLVHVIASGIRWLIHMINIVVCVTEWVGRKQLGEYEG